MVKYNIIFAVTFAISLAVVSSLPNPTASDDDDDDDDTTPQTHADADDDGRVYKNPRNSPSVVCPRDEEQATLLGQKCLRKCSSDEDCKSKKKKCLCDGACGMSCIKPGQWDFPSQFLVPTPPMVVRRPVLTPHRTHHYTVI